MKLTWSEWANTPWKSDSPYVAWHIFHPPAGLETEDSQDRTDSGLYLAKSFDGDFRSFLAGTPSGSIFPDGMLLNASIMQAEAPDLTKAYGMSNSPKVPLPKPAINKGFSAHYKKHGDWAPAPADLPVVTDPDTVIMAVIDTGIALGHNRFRNRNGDTRFLAAWQQTAPHRGQAFLPFGAELYRDDINRLLDAHSVGKRSGQLKEDEFNEAAGLVDMKNMRGHRELAGRYAHGTMVADLAFGDFPGLADPRIALMAINLPDRATIHSSGIFLDYFLIYGIKRIADLADLIFDKSRAEAVKRRDERVWPTHGFPVVVNLSFGKNAGSKDGRDAFSSAVREINGARSGKRLPIQLVIPVGNHNLERGCAEVMLASGAQDQVTFITQPEDQTPNFLEIWTEHLDNSQGAPPSGVSLPLEIDIIPPGQGQPVRHPAPTSGGHLHSRALGSVAGLYCYVRMEPDNAGYKVSYVLCTAPTMQQESPLREASPSGRWTVVLRNTGSQALRVYLSAQTDQSILPHGGTGRRPRLERADYEKHVHPSGRLRDSYNYPYRPGGNLDNSPVLRRHGSINALSTSNEVVAVAGYRLSDGSPALFSSTGHAYKLEANSLAGPTVAFPTDESPAHFGLLGAGGSNGSVVAMRGTSFAAALASRWIVRSIMNGTIQASDVIGGIAPIARKDEKPPPRHYPGETPPQPKIGHGRIKELPDRMKRTMHPP